MLARILVTSAARHWRRHLNARDELSRRRATARVLPGLAAEAAWVGLGGGFYHGPLRPATKQVWPAPIDADPAGRAAASVSRSPPLGTVDNRLEIKPNVWTIGTNRNFELSHCDPTIRRWHFRASGN